MQPKRLLQVASLLLLSAAVLGQVELSAIVPSIASLPAEVQPAAYRCFQQSGTACVWGTNAGGVTNCQLAQAGVCQYCRAGFFLEANTCNTCPVGAFCGGRSPNPTLNTSPNVANFRCDWANGVITSETGRWSPTQCDTCIVGWGPLANGVCTPCAAGTAKNQNSAKECDFCLDGFIANANSGATDCLDNTRRGRDLLDDDEDEEEEEGRVSFISSADRLCADALRGSNGEKTAAKYSEEENSCVCKDGWKLNVPSVAYNAKLELEPTPPTCSRST